MEDNMQEEENTAIPDIAKTQTAGNDYLANFQENKIENMINPYRTINGMTEDQSQNIGRIANSMSGMGQIQPMQPVNKFAQVLLNNKSLLGAAGDFAGKFAQSLQKPQYAGMSKDYGGNVIKILDQINKEASPFKAVRGFYDEGKQAHDNAQYKNGLADYGASKTMATAFVKSMVPVSRLLPDGSVDEMEMRGAAGAAPDYVQKALFGKGTLTQSQMSELMNGIQNNFESHKNEWNQAAGVLKNVANANMVPQSYIDNSNPYINFKKETYTFDNTTPEQEINKTVKKGALAGTPKPE